MIRALYRLAVRLHPRPFRERFGAEMLCVFDQIGGTGFRLWLLADALMSIVRQRALRPRELPAAVSASGGPLFAAVDTPSAAGRMLLRGFLPAIGLCLALSLAMKQAGRNPGFYFDPYFERARAAVQGTVRTQVEGATSDAGELPPAPEPADSVIRALRMQFRTSDAVVIGEWHSSPEDSEIRLELIRSPGFAAIARNVVFECASSLHQATLDRFLEGAAVPMSELRAIWRDVPTPGGCDDPVYERFLHEARSAGLRVFAAGPPIDWARAKNREQVAAHVRNSDAFAADIVARLLRQREKVLVVFGAGRLWRHTHDSTLVSFLDREFPGRVFTVLRMPVGAGRSAAFVPLRGTPAGGLDANAHIARGMPMPVFPAGTRLEEVADAIVFSGSRQSSQAARPPDPEWAAEIERRLKLRQGR